MSFEARPQRGDLTERLNSCYPNLKRVDQAPTFDKLLTDAGYYNNHPNFENRLEAIIHRESETYYKSTDKDGRCVYQVKNPALLTYQSWRNVSRVLSDKPLYLGPLPELRKIKNTPEQQNDWGSI